MEMRTNSGSPASLIARNTLILYVRMLFTMLVSLYTSRVVLNALGVVDFGLYNVVGGVISLFAVINGALTSGTLRFIACEIGRDDQIAHNRAFCMTLNVHLLVAVLVFILGETAGLWFLNTHMNIPPDRMVSANWVYQFSIYTAIISITQVPYTAEIMGQEKMSIYAYVGILEVIIRLLSVITLIFVTVDKLKYYAVIVFICSTIIAFIYRIYCIRKFPSCKYTFIKDKALFKEIMSFAGWNLFGSMAFVASNQGVNILFNLFFGAIINAAYGIANQVNTALQGFVQNFMTALKPQIIKSYAMGQIEYFESLILRSAKFSYILLFILCAPLIVDTEYVLTLWLGVVPTHSVFFCRIVLFLSLINVINDPLHLASQATGNIKRYQIIISALVLTQVLFSYILLMLGLMATTVYSLFIFYNVIFFAAKLMLVKMLVPSFHVKIFLAQVVVVPIAVSMVVLLLIYSIALSMEPTIIRLMIIGIVGTTSAGFLFYSMSLSKREKKYVVEKSKAVIRKIINFSNGVV